MTGVCWEWIGGTFKHPRTRAPTYGCFWIRDKNDGTGRMAVAHRVAWVLTFGGFPDDLKVLHRCDNTLCVRPEHLFIGSQYTNVRDMIEKGRAWWQR